MRSSYLATVVAVVFAFLAAGSIAGAQATPTASRVADLQIGAAVSLVSPDTQSNIYNLAQPDSGIGHWVGYGAYIDLDFYHLGIEANVRQSSGSDATQYERTFQIGPRFVLPVGDRFVPYAKGMIGRGTFNFAALDANGRSYQLANIGYNMESVGGGVDLHLRQNLNVRVVDYEYQIWNNFPPNKLHPQVLSFGVAYHFNGPLSVRR